MADQQLSCAGLQRGLRGLGGGRVSCFPGHGLVRVGECRLVVQQVDSSDELRCPGRVERVAQVGVAPAPVWNVGQFGVRDDCPVVQ